MAISKIIGSGLGTINSPVEFTSADNLTQLTLSSTDADANSGPNLDFYRNSASPADNDLLAKIRIQGKNDAGQQVLYSFIDTYALDVTDGTEDGGFYIYRMMGGSSVESLSFTATEAVFNESSGDYDFRVESNGNANMLFVDGGNNAVGIKTNTPATHGQFSVRGAIATTNFGSVSGDFSDATTGSLKISHASGVVKLITDQTLSFRTGTTVEGLKIDATGTVTMPLQPAFFAVPASDQSNFAVNSDVVVVFGTEKFDQNADFSSNTFTAPVTGKYQLNLVLALLNVDSASGYYYAALNTSNLYISAWIDPDYGQDSSQLSISMSVLADMDANDTAVANVRQGNGTQQTDIDTASYFSGFLVA
jgi:prepilin-type processing-associated H-X9-DG protein